MTERIGKRVLWKVVFIAFILSTLLSMAALRMECNEMERERAALEDQISALRLDIERMEYRLSLPFDYEYVEMVAREKLGLCYPDEIVVGSPIK